VNLKLLGCADHPAAGGLPALECDACRNSLRNTKTSLRKTDNLQTKAYPLSGTRKIVDVVFSFTIGGECDEHAWLYGPQFAIPFKTALRSRLDFELEPICHGGATL
jgi:hypothetical protein